MAGTIIYLVISFIVSLVFVILGVSQYKSNTPVALNSGEKPPREDELTDVVKWNHQHGRNLIIYGCVLFLTLTVFVFCIELFDSVVIQMIVFLLVIIGELVWLEIQHFVLKKKYIKN